MGIISTSTLNVFVSSTTIEASDTVKAFDVIYDVVNGGLDGSNLASTFNISASSLTINDPNGNLSSTKASLIATELTMKGWNTIHVLGLGTGGFDVFPGLIEVNGKYCRLNSRIHFSGINNITIVTSSSDKVFALTVGEAPILTASDFKLERYTATTTVVFSLQKNGYYTTASRRGICTFRCDITASTNDNYLNDEFFQQPSIGHRYKMAISEATMIGFNSNVAIVTNSASNGWTSVYQIFDMNDNRYYYDVYGTLPSALSQEVTIFQPDILTKNYILGEPNVTGSSFGFIGPSGSIQHHYFIDVARVYGASFPLVMTSGPGGTPRPSSFTPYYFFYMKSTGATTGRVTVKIEDNELSSGAFFVRIKQRPDSQRRQT